MTEIRADLCVIGAGSGGLTVAAGAAMLGRKVVLVEQGEMGGDCLNAGCVPSKALIAAAAHAHAAREAAQFGVMANPAIDFSAVIDHVQGVVAAIAPNDSEARFRKLGVEVIRERAAFVGRDEIEAGPARIRAKRFVIATGSKPALPPIPGLKETPYFTNETIFSNRTRPEHLVVVGAGAVGVELAQAFRRLGSRVTLIEAMRLINGEDEDAAAALRAALEREGVDVRENAPASSVRAIAGGVEVAFAGGKVAGSHLLVATGRSPNVGDMGLEKAGVGVVKSGVAVDARLRTDNRRIYAIGDAVGGAFTHVAGDHASTVVRNILFRLPSKRRDHLAPRAIFTDPEIAAVGWSETQCRERGGKVARWDFSRSDRAETERATAGFVKAMADRRGRLAGAVVVGRHAGDLIASCALAVARRLPLRAFADFIAPYPTRGEGMKRAASAYFAPALFSDRTKLLVRILWAAP